jgi:rubrerythrin
LMSVSKVSVRKDSLRVCSNCGVVYSTALTKNCPSCKEPLGFATEISDM